MKEVMTDVILKPDWTVDKNVEVPEDAVITQIREVMRQMEQLKHMNQSLSKEIGLRNDDLSRLNGNLNHMHKLYLVANEESTSKSNIIRELRERAMDTIKERDDLDNKVWALEHQCKDFTEAINLKEREYMAAVTDRDSYIKTVADLQAKLAITTELCRARERGLGDTFKTLEYTRKRATWWFLIFAVAGLMSGILLTIAFRR